QDYLVRFRRSWLVPAYPLFSTIPNALGSGLKRSATPRIWLKQPDKQKLVVTDSRDHILLVDEGRRELKSVPPDDCLSVVRVGPDCMECVIGANRKIGIVADKATTEMIARVYRMGSDDAAD